MKLSDNKLSGLMIRIGLGLFFLVFGVLKFTSGSWFIEGPYKGFYGIVVPAFLLIVVGIIQIAMAVSFFMDKYSKWSGWVGSVMLLSTILATLPKISSTFVLPPPSAPPGFLFFAAVPLLFMALSEALKEEKTEAKKEEKSEVKHEEHKE